MPTFDMEAISGLPGLVLSMRKSGRILGKTKCDSLRRQPGQNSCYNEKRRNVAVQVAGVLCVGSRLHSHGGSVDDAGPDGEGDEAYVTLRIARCKPEEDSQCRIDGDHHLKILGLTRVPCPT